MTQGGSRAAPVTWIRASVGGRRHPAPGVVTEAILSPSCWDVCVAACSQVGTSWHSPRLSPRWAFALPAPPCVSAEPGAQVFLVRRPRPAPGGLLCSSCSWRGRHNLCLRFPFLTCAERSGHVAGRWQSCFRAQAAKLQRPSSEAMLGGLPRAGSHV